MQSTHRYQIHRAGGGAFLEVGYSFTNNIIIIPAWKLCQVMPRWLHGLTLAATKGSNYSSLYMNMASGGTCTWKVVGFKAAWASKGNKVGQPDFGRANAHLTMISSCCGTEHISLYWHF